jgi:CHAD domain-containing protein
LRRAVQDEAGGSQWLDDLQADLKLLAARLGVARDWDVFLSQTAAEIRRALPAERRITQLVVIAGRKRAAAYAALAAHFAAPGWPRLEMNLALLPTLRPWDRDSTGERAERLAGPLRATAAQALDRRAGHVLAAGEDISGLPLEQLHDIRKQAKRLRYGVEFFAPLFGGKPARKYAARLEHLQEILGTLNDADVAAGLVRQLGDGADRAYAAGVIEGFQAARAARARQRLQSAWTRFRKAPSFWG